MKSLRSLGTQIAPFTTLGVSAQAQNILAFNHFQQLLDWVEMNADQSFMILGGGSNVLFAQNYEGSILLNRSRGIRVISDDSNQILVEVESGENWHEFVTFCIRQKWYGIENLALIPGTVGAAPIQNIGAYGVELKDCLHLVTVFDRKSREIRNLSNAEAEFGYRDSIFKKDKSRYFIKSIQLWLHKNPYKVQATYRSLADRLTHKKIVKPTTEDIYNAVIEVRSERLPDPLLLGNAGSFFKNPIVSDELACDLKQKYADMPTYPAVNGVKLAAGWLIDKAGLKGYRLGDAGTFEKQALVLVNYGQASGEQLWGLAKEIIQRVNDSFNVELQPEVNIIGKEGLMDAASL